jgi:hypothetical protein
LRVIETFSAFEEEGNVQGNETKLTKDQQQALVIEAVREWISYTDQIADKREQSLENWQAYLQNTPAETGLDTNNTDGGSRVRTGQLASLLDGIQSQLYLAAFPSQEAFYDAVPRNKFSAKYKTNYEKLCQYNNKRLNMLYNAFVDIKQLLLDGTSAVWHPFVRKERKKAVYVTDAGAIDPEDVESFDEIATMGEMKKELHDAVEVEGTAFYPILFENWRCDPSVDDIDKTSFLYRHWEYPEDLQDIDEFENTSDLLPYRDMFEDESWSDRLDKLEYQGIQYETHMGADATPDQMPYNQVCVIEKWGDFYVDGKLYRNHVLVFSNDRIFHYFGPNPYDHGQKPFSVAPAIPVPGSLYGKTSISDAIPLMHALDTMMNQVLDGTGLTASPVFGYNTSDTVLHQWVLSDRKMSPGTLVPMNNPGSIFPISGDFRGLQVIDGMMKQTMELMKDTTGGVPYATGGAVSPQDRTLGEVEILAAGTNSRFQTMLQMYEQKRLRPFVYQEFDNYRQFMTEPVRLENIDKPLSPNIVKMLDYDFDVTGSRSVLNKARSLQDKREALGMLAQGAQSGAYQLQPSTKLVDPMPIIESLLKDLDVNTDDVIKEQAQGGFDDNGLSQVSQPQLGGADQAMGIPVGPPSLPGAGGQIPPEGGIPPIG